jgi:ribonucleoside-diphosphate reductase alpha chain
VAPFVGEKGEYDWVGLENAVKMAVHFLDNVVELNEFPVQKITETVKKFRRIGLGVMGFADMLFKLQVRYDSETGLEWAGKVMGFINEKAKEATIELGKQRGVFLAWEDSVFANTDYRPRNMALTTIAPTGTISMIADASSGIEPVFSLAYQKNTVEGKVLYHVNPILVEVLKKRDLYNDALIEKIVKNGGVLGGLEEIPDDIKETFRTALEIAPEWHIKVQAAFQEQVDNAVSKTINFPKEASVEDVRQAYLQAYSLGTKGITIYRTGSREKEILQKVKTEDKNKEAHSEGNGKSDLYLVRKKSTPNIANGVRVKKGCDMGNVYTSVFFQEGDGPVEVFVTLGKSGGYMAGSAEVTGRLASLALKYGASLNEVAEEMVGISCGQKVGLGSNTVLSMFDAVGKSILEIWRGQQLDLFNSEEKVETVKQPETLNLQADMLSEIRTKIADTESKFSSCPDCGSPLYAEEGCFKCSNSFCGYSKCS